MNFNLCADSICASTQGTVYPLVGGLHALYRCCTHTEVESDVIGDNIRAAATLGDDVVDTDMIIVAEAFSQGVDVIHA